MSATRCGSVTKSVSGSVTLSGSVTRNGNGIVTEWGGGGGGVNGERDGGTRGGGVSVTLNGSGS